MTAAKAIKAGPRDERGVLAARILAAARESFAEHGLAGTSVRAIARSADVDPALVYHYYGSKNGLLDACTTPPGGVPRKRRFCLGLAASESSGSGW